MMTLSFLLFSFSIFTVSFANEIEIQNNCPFTVWPGIQGRIGHSHLENGGFELGANMARIIKSPHGWSGIIWGRTQCNSLGKCVTGDCGSKIQCNGTRGKPPVSFVMIDTLLKYIEDKHDNFSYSSKAYEYNLPVVVKITKDISYACGNIYNSITQTTMFQCFKNVNSNFNIKFCP